MADFRLNDNFVEKYVNMQPDWGPIGYITYKSKYARPIEDENRTEEWWETVRRVVEGTYGLQKAHCERLRLPWNHNKAQRSAEEMYDLIFNFKFLPPGRGLWMMGTDFVHTKGSAALNNPLGEKTLILTKEYGWIPIGDIEGQKVSVLSNTKLYGRNNSTAANAKWVEANISHAEDHPCSKITYRDSFGATTTILASQNHRWFRRRTKSPWERVTTEELKVGDYLPVTKPPRYYKICREGSQHGFFFGDGTRSNGELHQFTDENVDLLREIFTPDRVENAPITTNTEEHYVVRQCPLAWGELPAGTYRKDQRYLYGFLAGYVAADGHVDKYGNVTLSSARLDELNDVKDLFLENGIRTSDIFVSATKSNLVENRNPLYTIRINPEDVDEQFFIKENHKERWLANRDKKPSNWLQVTGIERVTGTHKVFCATVPEYEQFVIEGFCLTSNCAFVSTKDINLDFADPFCFLMDMSMLGVGVGGDTKGAGKFRVKEPRQGNYTFTVEDSREGWVELIRTYLEAYAGKGSFPKDVDYSQVRPYGAPIKTFGGTASGPAPLQQLVEDIQEVLNPLINEAITSAAIADIFNAIGRCVVSGNVRRSAEILLGDPNDLEFLDLKDVTKSERHKFLNSKDGWRWASNNSVFSEIGMDYSLPAARTRINGEIGYFWLETARRFGRMCDPPNDADLLVEGCNPCGEQSLESYELCCVSGDTKILTKIGYKPIASLVDIPTQIWNGKEWSQVTPFIAAHDKNLYRVHLSDGSYLDVTDNHKWSARLPTQTKFRQYETMQLEVGMQLEQTEIQPHDMDSFFLANGQPYAWGFFAGDGFIDDQKAMISLHGQKDYLTTDYFESINSVFYKEQQPEGYAEPFRRVHLKDLSANKARLKLAHDLNNKNKGIPTVFFTMDDKNTLDFIAGWIDSDGNVCHQANTDNYRIFGTEAKMRDMQLLLRRVGINHASVYKMAEAGEQLVINGRPTTRNYDLWVCYIPSYECARIADHCIIKKTTRIGDRYRINNAHPDGKKIDTTRNQYIKSIDKLDGKHTVYCFHEPKRNMGVFGNCLTYQCLVETFPGRHGTFEEYVRTLKFAYLYAKTVTLIPTHNARTNAVMLRNRRIGTSQSGIIQSIRRHGVRTHFEWCKDGYDYIRDLDSVYSRWLCVPTSVKVTSVKPSGTISLLCGATPGVHFPLAEYYWRTQRFDAGSPFVTALRKAGYRIEEGEGHNTVVVYFPVKEEGFWKCKEDITIWEQLELAAQMQAYWSDNQVSITVTFKKEEAGQIPLALQLYETRLKAVSFLPLLTLEEMQALGYDHPPYQKLTKEEYEQAVKGLKEIRMKKGIETEGFEKTFCDSDRCELPQPVKA